MGREWQAGEGRQEIEIFTRAIWGVRTDPGFAGLRVRKRLAPPAKPLPCLRDSFDSQADELAKDDGPERGGDQRIGRQPFMGDVPDQRRPAAKALLEPGSNVLH